MSDKGNIEWLENRCFLATYDFIEFMPEGDGKQNYIIHGLYPYTLTTKSKEYDKMIENMKSDRERYSKGLALIEVKKIYAPAEHTEARLRQIEIEMDNLLKEKNAIKEALKGNEE